LQVEVQINMRLILSRCIFINFYTRHFIVHNYSFTLELDLFSPLIENLPNVYRDFKSQIVTNL